VKQYIHLVLNLHTILLLRLLTFVPPTQHVVLQEKVGEKQLFQIPSVHITGFVSYNEKYTGCCVMPLVSLNPYGVLPGVTFIVLVAKRQYKNVDSKT
jgi:hypothetical protein